MGGTSQIGMGQYFAFLLLLFRYHILTLDWSMKMITNDKLPYFGLQNQSTATFIYSNE